MTKSEAKIDTYYTKATIYFPEYAEWGEAMPRLECSKEFVDKQIKINLHPRLIGDSITYTKKGVNVTAKIFPHNIPYQLSEISEIKERIVNPIVTVIETDVNSIEDLINELRGLTRKDVISAKMYYTKTISEDRFEVFDYSTKQLFKKLHKIKKCPQQIIAKEYVELYKLADVVNLNGDEISSVAGRTLREATKTALKIYMNEEKIEALAEGE